MRRIACGAAVILAVASGTAAAQGVQPGGPVYNSTGTGSGLGGVVGGTGPTWPNGTNPAPQPVIPSVPPGGYPSPAPPSTYTPSSPGPRSTYIAPSTRPSPYPRPNEPFATSTPRPPATIPLQFPAQPNGSLGFVKGCWRSDNFAYAGHRGTVTWCFDDRGGGRYLYTRTDSPNVFFCHAQAEARWDGPELRLSAPKASCDDGSANAPAEIICRDGTDGALCSDPGKSWTVRLYRVR
jgi:hypothetical protein